MGNAENKEKKPKRIEAKETATARLRCSLIREDFTNMYYLTVKVCEQV